MNGLEGVKIRGRWGGGGGQPKEKRENKWISRGKTGGEPVQPKEKRENEWFKTNGLVGVKTGGW